MTYAIAVVSLIEAAAIWFLYMRATNHDTAISAARSRAVKADDLATVAADGARIAMQRAVDVGISNDEQRQVLADAIARLDEAVAEHTAITTRLETLADRRAHADDDTTTVIGMGG